MALFGRRAKPPKGFREILRNTRASPVYLTEKELRIGVAVLGRRVSTTLRHSFKEFSEYLGLRLMVC